MHRAKDRSSKIVEFRNLTKLSRKLHKQGQKIVFVAGSFELVTPGHCRFLAEAKALGSIVVVGVCSDRSITKIHGPDFPLLSQTARMEMLSYLKVVDYITVVDEGEPHAPIVLLKPDICYVSKKDLDGGVFDDQAKYLLKLHKGRLVEMQDDRPYKSAYALAEHIADVRFIEIIAAYLWSKSIDFGLNKIDSFKPADFGSQTPNSSKAFTPVNVVYKDPLDLTQIRQKLNPAAKNKVVFVSGSYDLLHVGHARFIEKAALLGDILVVGIPSDAKISAKKGYGRPIISEFSRAYVLGSLDFVDYVYIFNEDTVATTLEILKPDIFFTVDEGWNNGLKTSPEYKIVKKYGGKVVLAPRQSPFVSSSTIINKVALKKVKEIFRDCMQADKFKALLKEGGINEGEG